MIEKYSFSLNTRFRGVWTFSSMPQWGQVQPQRASANAPLPCHWCPHSPQVMMPLADLRPICSKLWWKAYCLCTSVILGSRLLRCITSFCIFVLGFIIVRIIVSFVRYCCFCSLSWWKQVYVAPFFGKPRSRLA